MDSALRAVQTQGFLLRPGKEGKDRLLMIVDEVKRERGLEPGGIRLSVGLVDWHDIIEDLSTAFEKI